MFVFFFFKQKTAYEMRISDWSSDVCSSDLAVFLVLEPAVQAARVQLGGVACPPVERQGCADPLARYVIIAIFELFEEGNAVLLLPAFGLDIVGRKLAPVIGDAAGDAEILAQPCREIHAALGRELFGED